MDYYLSQRNCYKRIEKEYKKYGRLILCVDFDDTLFDYHNAGRSYQDIIALLRRWEQYSEVIILTSNPNNEHSKIERYLNDNHIKYKGINCESSVVFGGRKPYANVYIDDRGGLPSVYRMLKKLIKKIEKGGV